MQLFYLESALSRMRAVESHLVLPSSLNGAEKVPVVRLQLVVIATANAVLDLQRLHPHWMNVHHSIVWLQSTAEINDYQVVAARQDAWLRQRYPDDAAVADVTAEATLNLERTSSITAVARHLLALLEQQRRDPTWSARYGVSTAAAGHSKVTLPYLVFADPIT
jgi:hypothetical protein